MLVVQNVLMYLKVPSPFFQVEEALCQSEERRGRLTLSQQHQSGEARWGKKKKKEIRVRAQNQQLTPQLFFFSFILIRHSFFSRLLFSPSSLAKGENVPKGSLSLCFQPSSSSCLHTFPISSFRVSQDVRPHAAGNDNKLWKRFYHLLKVSEFWFTGEPGALQEMMKYCQFLRGITL